MDAAVAATFCMAAVAPHVTGIGGGGIMLVHMNRRSVSGLLDLSGHLVENVYEFPHHDDLHS